MSTKVFNAYIYCGCPLTSAAGLFALAENIRNTLIPHCRSLFYSKVAEELTRNVDTASIRAYHRPEIRAKCPGTMVTEAHDVVRANLRKGYREPSWDFNAEIVFYQVGAKLLLRVFAENEVISFFESTFPEFKDYHYQNCSDRPADVTTAEWNTRRQAWNTAYREKGAFDTLIGSLGFSLWGEHDGPSLWERKEAMAQIPDFHQRVHAAASDFVRDRWCAARVSSSAPMHEWSRVLSNWADARKTADVLTRIEKLMPIFEVMLPRDITIETIRTENSKLRSQALGKLRSHKPSRSIT